MPNRLGPGDKQPARLKVPEGHTIRWVPKNPTKPTEAAADDPTTIGPVEQAQLFLQKQRLAEGRGPAEPGEGIIPTGQTGHDGQTREWLDEQRERFSVPSDE